MKQSPTGSRISGRAKFTEGESANSGTQYSIIRGHALAAINLREESIKLAEGSEPRIVQECEEVVAVYASVFANSGEAVMNGEPVRWCHSLMSQSFMSKEIAMNAISIVSNKIMGISRFGPAKAELYLHTLAAYWAPILRSFIPSFANALTGIRPGDALQKAVSVLRRLGDEGHEDYLTYVFRHGRPGLMAIFVRTLLSELVGDPGSSVDNLIYADGFLKTTFLTPSSHLISFYTLVSAVDALVDGAMSMHINKLIGNIPPNMRSGNILNIIRAIFRRLGTVRSNPILV